MLTQVKEDPIGAEEYYSRAIQADAGNGEMMAEYAKLVWELHHHGDKASSFFEQAVEASPGNRYILFPWSPQFGLTVYFYSLQRKWNEKGVRVFDVGRYDPFM